MDFLKCLPIVFVIGNEYEILINTIKNGICAIEVNGIKFYEDNCGVYNSEKSFSKIRIPQKALDKAKKYIVCYRESIDRKAYYSEFSTEYKCSFNFKPLAKKSNINIYHIADVHYRFELAKKTANYFKDALDLLIVNGDIGEVETEDNYFEVAKFVGDISQGMIPVLFVRGNHDTRGRLAEKYPDYFPVNGKRTYFQFEIGPFCGVALDCGEDKLDSHEEYAGVCGFAAFRQNETFFLQNLELPENKIPFAIAHICPFQTTFHKNDCFDIERQTYALWNKELSRLGIKFMISAHMHKAYLLDSHHPNNILDHDFPVIVGSACFDDDIWGTAITIFEDKVVVRFTNSKNEIQEEFIL